MREGVTSVSTMVPSGVVNLLRRFELSYSSLHLFRLRRIAVGRRRIDPPSCAS
jgi:hypothetical protein